MLELPNVIVPGRGPMPLSETQAALARSVVTWEDLRWIREVWAGPIVVKGVLTGEDARRALDEGAAGVIVSNHGGRQLDGVAASLRALPEVVKAVGGRAEVSDGWRYPARERHRKSDLPGGARGADWTRLCIRPWRSGRGGCGESYCDFARRPGAHVGAAWLRINQRAESILCGHSRKLAAYNFLRIAARRTAIAVRPFCPDSSDYLGPTPV